MANEKVIAALNRARARELAVIMQYMDHHYEVTGLESPPAAEALEDVARVEMKHAEALAERIVYLGGVPTTTPDPVMRAKDLNGMLELDLKAENEAIKLYKGSIKVCQEADDTTSRRLFEDILAQEEEHANTFETLLGIQK